MFWWGYWWYLLESFHLANFVFTIHNVCVVRLGSSKCSSQLLTLDSNYSYFLSTLRDYECWQSVYWSISLSNKIHQHMSASFPSSSLSWGFLFHHFFLGIAEVFTFEHHSCNAKHTLWFLWYLKSIVVVCNCCCKTNQILLDIEEIQFQLKGSRVVLGCCWKRLTVPSSRHVEMCMFIFQWSHGFSLKRVVVETAFKKYYESDSGNIDWWQISIKERNG